ncbi:MAG: GNAT family N-acetyltransferase [Betaproteobacteria bacterium]|nr:GNAT family N-acetyltransferase [Betaproteobacteria bacterium]
MSLQLNAPQPLATTHILERFECNESVLDKWLKLRAMVNQLSEASRTFVVADQDNRVYGYFAMAASVVSHQMATTSVHQNMPVPEFLLARLKVDHHAQGIKLGASMLQNRAIREVVVSQIVSIRALLVHALHDRAKEFYEHHGFKSSPLHPMSLMLRLNIGNFNNPMACAVCSRLMLC